MQEKVGVVDVPATGLTSCDSVACELLVDPIPRPTPEALQIRIKPEERRVTFVQHSKPNVPKIVDLARTILRERGVTVNEEVLDKGHPSHPMKADMLEHLSGEKGLVLFGPSD